MNRVGTPCLINWCFCREGRGGEGRGGEGRGGEERGGEEGRGEGKGDEGREGERRGTGLSVKACMCTITLALYLVRSSVSIGQKHLEVLNQVPAMLRHFFLQQVQENSQCLLTKQGGRALCGGGGGGGGGGGRLPEQTLFQLTANNSKSVNISALTHCHPRGG